ncbi:acetate/propionate family kinase [Candidatus Peregrinibacteria bacterium]|nr:acetate/propionate family kinase [Candidatus Peregrinibacteria bacterium]
MSTLVINAGSSSLKFALFGGGDKPLYKAQIDAIGLRTSSFRKTLRNGTEIKTFLLCKNHELAIKCALDKLLEDRAVTKLSDIRKVAHRVVHGGEKFTKTLKINGFNLRKLEKLSDLAPLHNPANIACIKACRKILWQADHYAIFDTAFHSTLPQKAFLYGLPYKLYKKEGIRRYGFHGVSHEYIGRKARGNVISCHIGNGVSVTAIQNGKSLDTSMGFTPLEGPMMGTRSGSIDPAIIFHLAKKMPLTEIQNLLEHKSGFKGLSGISSDIRDLYRKINSSGTKRVFDVFSYQMAKTILGLAAAFGGGSPDAIIFTAGIGENAFYLRSAICKYLGAIGVKLDESANRRNAPQIHAKNSKIKVLVVKTDEELAMATYILSL